jgi:GNAT superfamily N-acetyltransferase
MAKANELKMLNDLAFESEAYWGEDDDYMKHFSENYKVTEDMITNEYVYILEEENVIVGFFLILRNKEVAELELFYVKRSLIGKGYGKALWAAMINFCKEKGIPKIALVASADVAEFYLKLGAVEIEKMDSILKEGRIVSRLEVKI